MNTPLTARQKTLLAIRNSSAEFVRVALGVQLEDYMIDVFNTLDVKDKVLVFTCHGVGKTHAGARYVPSQLLTRPATKIIITAPTHNQIKNAFFKEIQTTFTTELVPFMRLGKLNELEWKVDTETFCFGLSVKKDAGSGSGQGTNSRLQGFHAKDKVIAIIDEGVGVEPQVWTMIDGVTGTAGDKVISFANPTSKNCVMYKKSLLPEYTVKFITCFMTPNFKENGITNVEQLIEWGDKLDELEKTKGKEAYQDALHIKNGWFKVKRRHLITVQWALQKLREWGPEHPSFLSKVVGRFPDDDGYTLIPLKAVEKAIAREYEIQPNDEICIGVDVARFGPDSTAFTTIEGFKQTGYEKHRKQDTVDVLIHLINYIRAHDRFGLVKIRVAIDAGFSHGVIDDIRKWLKGVLSIKDISDATKWERQNIEILEFGFGASDWVRWHFGWVDEKEYRYEEIEEHRELQEDRARYVNYKAKGFDMLATAVKNDLDLMDLECYKKELPTILLQSSGQADKFKIESKDEYKERTGEGSPDSSDSLMLAVVAKVYNRQPKSVFDHY